MSTSRFATSLRRDSIRTFFEASPTARLLRSDNAPLILDFLHRVFKSGERISIGQTDFRTRLTGYQEEIHDTEPSLLPGPPERYLTQWADAGWLQRFLEAASIEPQFQLTRYAEEAIQFVDSAIARGSNLVGTESRLRLVIDTLEDIVRGASADPDRRLDYLRAQRATIDQEIQAIESGKSVQVYRPAQIRERFQNAVDLLRALQSDFRAVEERFQSIAREVQQLQSSGNDSRGQILGHALDSEDLLKQQDEGISFFAFVSFLFSPTQQAALRKNIEEIQHLAALADQHESLSRVRRMVPSLLAEAEKVMRTTARLSATLRRLLDARAAAHRIRLANVLRDIRQQAMKLGGAPECQAIQLSVDAEAEISSPMARTFWVQPQDFDALQLTEQVIDPKHAQAMASAFARMQRLDLRKLRSHIREATTDGDEEPLPNLLIKWPLTGGVVELLGYLQIAHDDSHSIDPNHVDRITIAQPRGRSCPLRVSIPRIVFQPKASSRDVSTKPR
ncbi:MAG: DUF3375 domain-containing protein [Pirellula sp.]